jgi:hypothetical protein
MPKFLTKIFILLILFLFTLFFINAQVSDRPNDIHLFPLENITVDNSNGAIKLYFRLETAKLVNPDWKTDGTVVKRNSPTTGKDGYFLVEPLTNLTTKEITVTESPKGQNKFIPITALESDLKISSNPKEAKIFSILLLDVSGSITKSVDGKSPPVLPELKKAAQVFASKLNISDNRQLAVYAFDGRAELVPISLFSNNANQVKADIDKVDSSITKDSSTNLYGAIVKALDVLDKKLDENKDAITSGTITIFTDGTDRAQRLGRDGEKIVLQNMKDLKAKRYNVYFYTIGLGREYDEARLKEFGMDGYRRALTTALINQTFQELGERIDNLTKCYYRLEYITPSRKGAGTMQVIIDVKSGVYSGGYRITFDTSGFTF